MNSGERANMPTRQPSCASFLTSAAPSPGPTPTTIATRPCFLTVIHVPFASAPNFSRATRTSGGRRNVSGIERMKAMQDESHDGRDAALRRPNGAARRPTHEI